MDGKLLLPAVELVVQLAAEGIALVVGFVADFLNLQDMFEGDLGQLTGRFGQVDFGSLDFSLNILLFVGEKFIFFTVALDIGLLHQKFQGLFHLPGQSLHLNIETIQHQDAQIFGGGFEILDVFDQKEAFQQLDGKGTAEIIFSQADGLLNLGFQGGTQTGKHQVEGGQMADVVFQYLDGNLLKNTEHGTFAHRAVLPFKGVVDGEILNRLLKEIKLVGNERIGVDEMIPIAEIAIGLRPVDKIEKGFQVVGLPVVDVGKDGNAGLIFLQQPALNHLGDVGAGQLHAVGEAGLNFGKIIAVLFVHLTDDRVHVFLSGDDNPGLPPALGSQALGNGLQVGHQFDVVGDVLADLIDKEIKPETGGLRFDIAVDLVGEILN